VRVASVDGELIAYPTFEQIAEADLELTVAVSADAIVMVEGGADEATEAEVIDALMFAHEEGKKVIGLIDKMRAAVGKPKRAFSAPKLDAEIARRVSALVDEKIQRACVIKEKKAR
jgi:polyribonucleotide nucleotidyltransferase